MSEFTENRPRELRQLFGNLASGQSTHLAGSSISSSSSLLRDMAERGIQKQYLSDPARLAILYFDCAPIPLDLTPEGFWRAVFISLSTTPALVEPYKSFTEQLLSANDFDPFTLETYFLDLAAENCRLALLLDQLDQLMHCPEHTIHAVFSNLRGLSSLTGGLVLLFTSQHSLSELNEETALLNPLGSPLFNTYFEYRIA